MNIFLHPGYMGEKAARARRQQTYGTILIAVAFLLSFGSFLDATNLSWLILLAYIPLIIGFPMWQMGRSYQRRLANTPQSDTILNSELKGYNNKYSLHHYLKSGDVWIDHLLITPSGLIVMQTSDATGPVACKGTAKGDKWKSPTNIMDRITGLKPAIGNPTANMSAATAAARDILVRLGKPDVPVKSVILFTRNPNVEVDGCQFQGIPISEARDETRALQQDMDDERENKDSIAEILTSDDRRKLNALLAPQSVTLPANSVAARR
nr:Nuclease-related domain protein [uncultured bacterium]